LEDIEERNMQAELMRVQGSELSTADHDFACIAEGEV